MGIGDHLSICMKGAADTLSGSNLRSPVTHPVVQLLAHDEDARSLKFPTANRMPPHEPPSI